MLIHVVPQFFNKYSNVLPELIDVSIPELGLVLQGGKDIVARRPYPNKCYLVACRKIGLKAMTGLLIETHLYLKAFTSITRWALNAEMLVKHEVEHVVLDNDFDAVTGAVGFWYEYRDFANRFPSDLYQNLAPVHIQPRMEFLPSTDGLDAKVKDEITVDGIIMNRHHRFKVPTIESARLFAGMGSFADRIPPCEHIFHPETYALPAKS